MPETTDNTRAFRTYWPVIAAIVAGSIAWGVQQQTLAQVQAQVAHHEKLGGHDGLRSRVNLNSAALSGVSAEVAAVRRQLDRIERRLDDIGRAIP